MAAGIHGDQVVPTVLAASANVAGKHVHWITISNTHATESLKVEINDSADDSGTDRWAATVEAIDFKLLPWHAVFDPPIYCASGIYVDITDGTPQVVVGVT